MTDRLTRPQVRRRYGDISDATLWRWMQRGFPQPIQASLTKQFWRVEDLEAWEDSRTPRSDSADGETAQA